MAAGLANDKVYITHLEQRIRELGRQVESLKRRLAIAENKSNTEGFKRIEEHARWYGGENG